MLPSGQTPEMPAEAGAACTAAATSAALVAACKGNFNMGTAPLKSAILGRKPLIYQ